MKPETIAIHGGFAGDPTTHAVAVPIYQTTSYYFDDTQHGADLFDLKVQGNIYSRIMNPTNGVLEQRMAELEGGVGALAMASGMAAITATIQTLAKAGDNILSVNQLYGGTYNLFAHTFPQQGLTVKMFDADQPATMEALIDENTKAVFCESIGNPAGNVADLEVMAGIAHQHGIPLVVDNTVATPVLCRPFDFGADISIHSLTKYIGGHGTTIGGVIVDSGKFPWKDNPRFPQFNEPDPSYHGVVYVDAMGPAAFIARARVVPLRNMGGALSPFNAFMTLQGLETLALRMERHVENAFTVCQFLDAHPAVEWIRYPGLETSPHFALAKKYMQGKPASVLSFGIKGGAEAGARFIDALQMIKRLVNIGDAKTLACHPATTTHRQLNAEEQAAAGVTQDLVRLSIGIEHSDDIIADLEQALAKS
jgi:O-acetylhomoserine (thiol)-lyase